MGHFSFKMGTWMGGISKIPAAHPYPDQSWVPPQVLYCNFFFFSWWEQNGAYESDLYVDLNINDLIP